MLNAVLQAIEPASMLANTLAQWNQIAMDLRERSRRRVPQVDKR